MHLFVQTLALGIAIGGLYALMGVGLNLIFGVMRVANFAHGALYMAGGYAAYWAISLLRVPMLIGILSAALVGGVVGYLINAVLLRPIYRTRMDRPSEFTLIVTFAFSLIASAAATAVFHPDYRRFVGLWPTTIDVGGWIRMSGDRIVAFAAAMILIGVLLWLVYYTDLGRGWRALTQNRTGAQVVGVDVYRLANLAFGVAGLLAAAAGGLLVPLYLAYPNMGDSVVVKSFVIVVLGGLGSIGGSMLGGFVLALSEALGSTYLSPAYTDIYGLALMIAILLLRPQGLFGRAVRAI